MLLHLDSEYRDRYQEYYLANNEIIDSRKYNWRQVEWEKVIKIVSTIRNTKHEVNCMNKNFKFFMNFRWAGREVIGYKKYKEIKIWTVGWSDGKKCYLDDYDFKSGVKVKNYTEDLLTYKSHIHPRIINLGIIGTVNKSCLV